MIAGRYIFGSDLSALLDVFEAREDPCPAAYNVGSRGRAPS